MVKRIIEENNSGDKLIRIGSTDFVFDLTNGKSLDDILTAMQKSISDVKNQMHPVGSIYMSLTQTSPATLFGGTWERITDKFLMCAGNDHPAGTYGGSFDKSISTDNIPSHNHSISSNNCSTSQVDLNHQHYIDGIPVSNHAHYIKTEHCYTEKKATNHRHYINGISVSGSVTTPGIDMYTGMQSYFGTGGGGLSPVQDTTEFIKAGGNTPKHVTYELNATATGYTDGIADGGINELQFGVYGSTETSTDVVATGNTNGMKDGTNRKHTHTVSGSTDSSGNGTKFDITNSYYSVYVWRRTA